MRFDFASLIKKRYNLLWHMLYPNICISCSRSINNEPLNLCIPCAGSIGETDYHTEPKNFFFHKMIGKVPIIQASSLFFFSKESVIHDLVHQIKYKGRKDLAIELGNYYGELLKDSEMFQIPEILVPVPLHPLKLLKRGYNQSEAFATGLNEQFQIEISTSDLQKVENNTSQTNKSRFKRLKNADEVFEMKSNVFNNRHIALVDDVMTTGATLTACVDAILVENPNAKISLITLAIVKN